MMDIENFIRYEVAEIYVANFDWPGNNVRCWRPKTNNGRFQWILYDTDAGFGFSRFWRTNTLEFATAPDSNSPSNPPWSTLFLRKLLENELFRTRFIVCFCDMMNITFREDRSLSHIDKLYRAIEDEMPAHQARWYPDHDWGEHVAVLRGFANNRKEYVVQHLREKFELSELCTLNLDFEAEDQGRILINGFMIDSLPWHGEYFEDFAVKLQAESFAGFQFTGWNGDRESDENPFEVCIEDDISISVLFEQDDGLDGSVVISEINYNSSDEFNPGDWIELNAVNGNHDLSGWFLRDENDEHEFCFPEDLFLSEGEYLIIVEDSEAFRHCFHNVEHITGNLGFGLDGSGETVLLYDPDGNLVDFVEYDDEPPWPTQPDGNGPTLQLISTRYANQFAHNWKASLSKYGDPGRANRLRIPHPVQKEVVRPACFEIISTYPNPFNSKISVKYQIPAISRISIQLFDVTGRRISTVYEGFQTAGFHNQIMNAEKLASGVYFITIKNNNTFRCQKIVLLR